MKRHSDWDKYVSSGNTAGLEEINYKKRVVLQEIHILGFNLCGFKSDFQISFQKVRLFYKCEI